MKKFFTLAAAVLASLSLWAETEIVPQANSGWEGTSVTIKHDECANGKKDITKDGDDATFYKFRTNRNGNTITLYINEGIKVTGVSMRGYSNNTAAHVSLSGVSIDGTAEDPFTPVVFPYSNASNTETYEKTGIEAVEKIVFSFDNSEIDSEDSNKKNAQIMAIITITYVVTAEKHDVTYKANYGDVKDSTETSLKVKDNIFFAYPKDQYFVGWNTKADGTGETVEAGTQLTQDTVLYAQWKEFNACVKMEIDSGLVKPAKNVEVALKEGSNGGKMFFAGAKEDDWEASFIYRKGGSLQLSKGGADSLRVELDKKLMVGSVVRVILIASSDGKPALNIIPEGKSAIEFASNIAVAEKDTVSTYYTVVDGDGLAGAKTFRIQRGGSTVILNTLAIDGCPSSDASINWLKINNAGISAEEKVFAYAVAADAELAEVEVSFELAAGATADKESGFKVDVPASFEDPASEVKLTVTAEDGETTEEYTIKVTRSAPDVPKSTDATIKELKINNELIEEKEGVFAFEAAHDSELAEVSVAFVLNEAHATADKENPFKLAVPALGTDPASEATINVTAEDGTTTKAYKIVVSRAKSSDASITSLKINNEEVKEAEGVFAYEVAYDADLAQVEVVFVLAAKATADKTSPLKIDVPASSEDAASEVAINVTAEDGTKKAYKIVVTREVAPSTDATIKSLTINGEEVKEDKGVFAYEVAAAANMAEVEVSFVLNDAKAKADKTNPFSVAVPASSEAAASEAVITVTAEDGTTKKAYKVVVTRAAEEQGIEGVQSTEYRVQKIMRDGQMIIIKNGIQYTVQGAVVQ